MKGKERGREKGKDGNSQGKVFLTQRGQDVAELGSHDRPVPLLVKHPEPFHEILVGPGVLGLGDVLEHGQEGLKVDHLGVHLWKTQGMWRFGGIREELGITVGRPP